MNSCGSGTIRFVTTFGPDASTRLFAGGEAFAAWVWIHFSSLSRKIGGIGPAVPEQGSLFSLSKELGAGDIARR